MRNRPFRSSENIRRTKRLSSAQVALQKKTPIKTGKIAVLEQALTDARLEINRLEAERAQVSTELSATRGELSQICKTRSWKITAPLRSFVRTVRHSAVVTKNYIVQSPRSSLAFFANGLRKRPALVARIRRVGAYVPGFDLVVQKMFRGGTDPNVSPLLPINMSIPEKQKAIWITLLAEHNI